MKNVWLLALILFACKAKPEHAEEELKRDALSAQQQSPASIVRDSAPFNDTSKNATLKDGNTSDKVTRKVEGDKLIHFVDASRLPISIDEEFTQEGQYFILKIAHYSKADLKAEIVTRNKQFNIRFSQIRLPDGSYDGPFGREIAYKIPTKGEVWLLAGRNNMADGETIGKFSIHVE